VHLHEVQSQELDQYLPVASVSVVGAGYHYKSPEQSFGAPFLDCPRTTTDERVLGACGADWEILICVDRFM
jgi:hypothetical protein